MMHSKTYALIRMTMVEYIKKGSKSTYKKVQMKRLIAIIENIFEHEKCTDLNAIGRRQIIGYWHRTSHESDKTRREKYTILKKFFEMYNGKVTVPQPRPNP
jgi:hypothetical protein